MSDPTRTPNEGKARLQDLASQLDEAVAVILEEGGDLDEETASAAVQVLASAVDLYGGLARGEGNDKLPMQVPSATTDAATAAAVLIISQNLSLFEFNVWYSRVAEAADIKRNGARSS